MSVPTIQISSTPTRISTHLQLGQSRIQTRYPSVDIQSRPPQANAHTNPAILEIDWTQTRAEIGLETQSIFMRHWRNDAKSHVANMTVQYAREGDTLGNIENGGDPIPRLAAQKSIKPVGFNIQAIPKTPPATTFQPADVDFNPSTPDPDIHFKPGEAYIDISNAIVDTRVDQIGRIDMSVSGEVFDLLA